MLLMKKYVSLTTAAMKMAKKHFYSDHSNGVYKEKKFFIGQFHVKSSRACHPHLKNFFEIFTSVRYHRDMKILKILASNSKRLRFYGIFKKSQIDDRGVARPSTTFS